jgi:Tfp pilus assembly protein PilF
VPTAMRWTLGLVLMPALFLPGCASTTTSGSSSPSLSAKPGAGASEPNALQKFNAAVAASPPVKAINSAFTTGTSKPKTVASSREAGDPLALTNKPPKPGPDLYLATARVYEKSGNSAAATDQYERLLKESPDHLDGLLGYARLRDREGRMEEATQLYQRAAKRHPNNATAHNDLGLCYARRKMHREAAQALAKAVELQPQRPLYRNNLATVLVEMRRHDEALAHLAAVHPPAVAHYNLGYLLHHNGQAAAALHHFTLALQADPTMSAAQEMVNQLAGGRSGAPSWPNSRQATAFSQTASEAAASRATIVLPGNAPPTGRSSQQPPGPAGHDVGYSMRYPELSGPQFAASDAAIPPSPGSHAAEAMVDDLRLLPPVENGGYPPSRY